MVTHDAEIYPSAPLEFVACELQFPVATSLASDDVVRSLHGALFDWLPVAQPEVETTLVFGPGTPAQQPPMTRQHLRFLSRDRQLCVVISPNRISVETTAYPGWQAFRGLVERALLAVVEAEANIPGLARVGLRYIDEIRVPEPGSGDDRWVRFVDRRLSGAATVALAGMPASDFQGALQFDLGAGQTAVVRYGARHGQAISDAPLRRRGSYGPGDEYFLIDIDSFWQAPPDLLPAFALDEAMSIADRLHEPVRAMFEASITEDLRAILRRTPAHG